MRFAYALDFQLKVLFNQAAIFHSLWGAKVTKITIVTVAAAILATAQLHSSLKV